MTAVEHPALALALSPAAWLYGRAIALRNRYYDRPGISRRATLPVISVGNLTAGGTGKTPLVAWLARQLRSEGRTPAVVSRGYGGQAGRGPLVVSRGAGPEQTAERVGDEPYLLARLLPGLRVVVGSDRVAGAAAARKLGATEILLDDGFQHRRLARDLDLVLLDAVRPFDNGRLLPAGLLREPPRGLSRADVVLATRWEPGMSLVPIERAVREHAPQARLLAVEQRRLGFVDGDGEAVEAPRRAVAFCGIGRPERFRADLEAEGVTLVEFLPFADHHAYPAAELERFRRLAVSADARPVTTEKDLARIDRERIAGWDPSVVALRIGSAPVEAERLLEEVRRALDRRAA